MDYEIEDRPTPYQWDRPKGQRGLVSWIVWHTPEGSGNPLATVRYLTAPGKPPAQQTGYHELCADGIVYRMAGTNRRVGHAGVATRIPGTDIRNGEVNDRTVGLSIDNRKGLRPAEAHIETGIFRTVDLILELELPDAGVVLGHREVSTSRGRRSDPTRIDMEWVRQRIHDELARLAAG